jgi:hypothetical protein
MPGREEHRQKKMLRDIPSWKIQADQHLADKRKIGTPHHGENDGLNLKIFSE